MDPNDFLEEKLGNMGRIPSFSVVKEMCHLRKLINDHEDGIMSTSNAGEP